MLRDVCSEAPACAWCFQAFRVPHARASPTHRPLCRSVVTLLLKDCHDIAPLVCQWE
jgi:hypothetical protein